MAVLVASDPESAAAPRLSPVIVPWGSALRYARSEYQQHATLRLALMEPRVGSPLLRPTSVIALLDTQVSNARTKTIVHLSHAVTEDVV